MNGEDSGDENSLKGFYAYKNTFDDDAIWMDIPKNGERSDSLPLTFLLMPSQSLSSIPPILTWTPVHLTLTTCQQLPWSHQDRLRLAH